MKTYCFLFLLLIYFKLSVGQQMRKPLPYMNPNLLIEKRVEDLLNRMTLKEKVYQMCALRLGDGDEIFKSSGNYSVAYIREQMADHGVGHISCPTTDMTESNSVKTINEIQKVAVEETRLGIPTLVNDEALHGIKGSGASSYPQAIALSCTWNLPLMAEIGDAIGQEALSRGIRQILSPVLDLARDPRHGRMEETYGEDPFLASKFGVEYIKNVQNHGIICAPKHFLANFAGEAGRDSKEINLSERELREIHLVPYQAAIIEAKAKSLMAAYNSIDGIPCHANKWLLDDVLRKEWKFTGFVVSDWSGINHLYGTHRVVNSLDDAAIMASNAGLDVDLPRLKSYLTLIESVKEGKIKETDIDENVKRILRVKFEIGLFEHPYIDIKDSTKVQDISKYRQLALKAAEQSIILIKNKGKVLPLKAGKIAVIGPNADKLQLGGYSARNVKGLTPYQAIENEFRNVATVLYAKGCNLTGNDKTGFPNAISTAKQADVIILVMGGSYGLTGGESQDRVDLNLMGVQEELINEIALLGKPVIVVLNDGRPSTMSHWVDKVDGIVMMFFAGEEGGKALAEILSGKVNPSGKLTVTFPRNTGQLPMPLLCRPYGREGTLAEYPELEKEKPFTTEKLNRYYPLYPFGYGLSYSNFEYSVPSFSKDTLSIGDSISINVNIANNSQFNGDEIVQFYFTDLICRISQPQKRLIGFKRITIPAGEIKTVHFNLTYNDLAFLNEKYQKEVDPGDFEIFIGKNATEGIIKRITVK